MAKKLALVLGSGGARGFAHIGVLRALTELKIKPEILVGCSIGAMVGAAAAMNSLDKLEKEASKLKVHKIPALFSPALSTQAICSGRGINKFLKQLGPDQEIETLPLKFAAAAVDIRSSTVITIDRGSLFDAVRASVSLPGLLMPIRQQDMVLIDGGILEPVPVRIAKELGASHVIAVDLFSAEGLKPPLGRKGFFKLRSAKKSKEPSPLYNGIEIMARTLAITQAHLAQQHFVRYPPDLIIYPYLPDTEFADFHRGDIAFKAGYEATMIQRDKIESLLSLT